MKKAFRLYRRGKTFYCENCETRKQESLRTEDRKEAERILSARNEAANTSAINRQIGQAYLNAADPSFSTRTWGDVFNHIIDLKQGSTRERWERASRDQAYSELNKTVVTLATAELFLRTLKKGGNSTNVFLRRVHNFALDMDWLLKPAIPKKQWPKITVKPARAITREEHESILAREFNLERKAYYEVCWHVGGSQGDIARLHAEDIDWEGKVVNFERLKTRWLGKTPPQIRIGRDLQSVLKTLPSNGPLFPYLIGIRSSDRATEFKQRCEGLGIEGVTLHSYRYSWAERAKTCGYSERYAMIALGHNSKAVARAYSKKARTEIPALEEVERAYETQLRQEREQRKIISIDPNRNEQDAVAA